MEAMMETWQTEFQELLANLVSSNRQQVAATAQRRKLHFQFQNCIDICQDTDRVSFMALPSNVILNIPIVASVMAEAPLMSDCSEFSIEVLSKCPVIDNSLVVLGIAQKGFKSGHEPGLADKSIGYKPSTGCVYKDGTVVYRDDKDTSCVVGDRLSCCLEQNDDKHLAVVFTKNGNEVCKVFVDSADGWYPVISMSSLKEEVRLLQQNPWRSIRGPTEPNAGIKMAPDTGHVSFRSCRPEGKRCDSLLLASQPFSRHFSFFEIEILALNEREEVAIGAVPEDYPRRLPGFRQRSVGFHARSGGIYGGKESKADGAPKCVVGDKMGCGVEHRANGKRIIFFTHNSKSFMEAELNANCPDLLFPSIGMRSRGAGTVSVCILDPSNWQSPDSSSATGKLAQVDMTSEVSDGCGEIVVDKDTARASFTSNVDVVKDAILVAKQPLSVEKSSFEVEILYGNLITVGLVPSSGGGDVIKHPGFTDDSIGYNAESGFVYVGGKSVKNASKSTYGERVGFSVKRLTDTQMTVSFNKNGSVVYECKLPDAEMSPAVGMRSAGHVLAVRLLDRELWDCHTSASGVAVDGGGDQQALLQLVDRELIECPICRDVFTDPRILPCSIHTFCAGCLQTYVAQFAGRRAMTCPVCRTSFTLPPGGVTDLPVNTIVTRLLDIRAKFPTVTAASQ